MHLAKSDGDPSVVLRWFVSLLCCTLLMSEASVERQPLAMGAAALCFIASLIDRTRGIALGLACLLQAARVVRDFPATANHSYLQLVLLVLAALLSGASPAERVQLLSSYRLIAAAVLFHAGVQKVLYGMYFDGRMLAVLISLHERYQLAFGPIIGASEVARLDALSTHVAGSGPFLVDSMPLIVISNITWLAELALGAWLLTANRWAPWLAALLIVGIELAARETVFGVVMLGLFALFLPVARGRVAIRVLTGFALIACAVAFDFLPGRGVLFLEVLP
jgi:hypothetical protein